MIEYNLIISSGLWKLIKKGAKKATITFKEGAETQKYIGWLVLNRDVKIYLHCLDGSVNRIIESRR